MWVCKNLATGEFLGALLDGGRGRILPYQTRGFAVEFSTMPQAAEFAFLACEEFDLDGFEPVSDDPAVTWENDPHWMGRGQE